MNVVVVDLEDRVIGVKGWTELTNSDVVRITGLWVTNSEGQVLMAQRAHDKLHDPGKWGPAVAGTVEEGETYETNIYKEAEEEIGLIGIEFKLGPKVVNKNYRTFFVQWFTCTLDWPIEKFKLQKEEVESLKWVDKKTLVRQLREQPDNFIAGAESVWKEFLT